MWVLEFDDVEYPFEGQLIKIEPVAGVVIGTDRFGVIVDHDGPEVLLLDGLDGIDRAPVEFDRASDPVCPRSQYNHRAVVAGIFDVVFGAVISNVEVVGHGRVFACQGIDLFDYRQDVAALAPVPDGKHALLHAVVRQFEHQPGNLEIGESRFLGREKQFVVKILEPGELNEFATDLKDVHQFLQEPAVYFGTLVNILDGHALVECFSDGKDPAVSGIGEFFLHSLDGNLLAVADKAVHTLSYHADPFLDGFLKRASDGHDFTYALHGTTDGFGDPGEFSKVPAGNFHHAIVECRFKGSRGHLGDRIFELV